MTYTEISRLVAYLIFVLVGAVALVFGVIRNDWELITLGGALLGTNILAGANVPGTTAKKAGRYADHEE